MDDHLRQDPMSGRWVALVPGRLGVGGMPKGGGALPSIEGRCPFCPGNEADTEVTVLRRPSSGPWRIRAVANRFPVTRGTAEGSVIASSARVPLLGRHEVIVESPDHGADLTDFSHGQLREVLAVYRDRLRALRCLPEAAHVALFRNRGRRAGSSQPHPHAQILTTPIVGHEVRDRQGRASEHLARTGQTLLASEIQRAPPGSPRCIGEHGSFLVLCPFAPRLPFETWIVPRTPSPCFSVCTDDELGDLASALQDLLGRLATVTQGAAYNLVFHLPAASRAEPIPSDFWYLSVLPRSAGMAGFELSTGIQIVTVTPEHAAAVLRGD